MTVSFILTIRAPLYEPVEHSRRLLIYLQHHLESGKPIHVGRPRTMFYEQKAKRYVPVVESDEIIGFLLPEEVPGLVERVRNIYA